MKKTFAVLFLITGCGQNLGVGNRTITYNNNSITVNHYLPQEKRESEESFHYEEDQQVLTLIEEERSLRLAEETDKENTNDFLEIKESEINFEVINHEINEEFCRSIKEEVDVEEMDVEEMDVEEMDVEEVETDIESEMDHLTEVDLTCDERVDLAIECISRITPYTQGSQYLSDVEDCYIQQGFVDAVCLGSSRSGDTLSISCENVTCN